MRARYRCQACGHTSKHVTASLKEIKYKLRKLFDCPECGETKAFERQAVSSLHPVDHSITADQFMFYVEGLADPGEVVTQQEPVVAMLLAHMVVEVDAESTDDRCVINSLTLNNGVKLHFAASGKGAVVWKATRVGDKDASECERAGV